MNRPAPPNNPQSVNLPYRIHSESRFVPAPTKAAATKVKWLPIIILCLYYMISWAPPIIPTMPSRWFVALGLGLAAYLTQARALHAKSAGFMWAMFMLSFAGAAVSIFRSVDTVLAAWNTVAHGINILVLVLFLPTLAVRQTRSTLLFVLVSMAILWTVVIQDLVAKYGTLAYSTFAETGDNKNAVGYTLSLAATVLFYLAIFWKPFKPMGKGWALLIRTAAAMLGVYLFYHQALIYARGSLIATLVGCGGIFAILAWKDNKKASSVFQIGFLLFVLTVIFTYFVLPSILEVSPYWKILYMRLETQGFARVTSGREELIEKGLYLISQNPVVGVGLGGTRASVSSPEAYYRVGLLHNTYLANWAEKGILGLFSDLIWIFAYVGLVRRKFLDLPLADQIWLMILLPFSVQMLFKDMSTDVMIILLVGIYYEGNLQEKEKQDAERYRNKRGW